MVVDGLGAVDATLNRVADWMCGQADSRKILIFLHVPLYESATKAKTVVWNAEERSQLKMVV